MIYFQCSQKCSTFPVELIRFHCPLGFSDCIAFHIFLLHSGTSLQEKLDENEFRREIYRKITGKCLQDLSDNFKQNREVCKVFISNIYLISLFFH